MENNLKRRKGKKLFHSADLIDPAAYLQLTSVSASSQSSIILPFVLSVTSRTIWRPGFILVTIEKKKTKLPCWEQPIARTFFFPPVLRTKGQEGS